MLGDVLARLLGHSTPSSAPTEDITMHEPTTQPSAAEIRAQIEALAAPPVDDLEERIRRAKEAVNAAREAHQEAVNAQIRAWEDHQSAVQRARWRPSDDAAVAYTVTQRRLQAAEHADMRTKRVEQAALRHYNALLKERERRRMAAVDAEIEARNARRAAEREAAGLPPLEGGERFTIHGSHSEIASAFGRRAVA